MRRKPIIVRGEKLASPIEKRKGGGQKENAYSYEDAKLNIISNIHSIKENLIEKKEVFIESEIIVCARMAKGYLAKSYVPDFLEKYDKVSFIGARNYTIKEGKKEEKSKLYFLKTDLNGLNDIKQSLESDSLNRTAKNQLCNIDRIDLLENYEKISSIDSLNEGDDVEIVLHPLKYNYEEAIKILESYIGKDYIVKRYMDGPIFVLAKIGKKKIEEISYFNFLRTVHPLRNIEIPQVRGSNIIGCPTLAVTNNINNEDKVKIGVFDGGVSLEHNLIKKFTKSYELSSLPADDDGIEHGTAVSGAVLYGELNKYSNNEILKEPRVFVENFRVLPEVDLYRVIDNIEKIVNDRSDIKIYNISFGPRGPIDDDDINRFTYSLDKLSYDKEVLFCVAVGNDGDVIEPFNRIQAPADLVNGIGVGSYSKYDNSRYRAPYSCIGLGREGAKIKPDVLAFGGDERTPFHAISVNDNERILINGTSFSSPIVAGRIGELLYTSPDIDPLVAKTIILHSADSELDSVREEGFGMIKCDIDDMINCVNNNEVTVLYTGKIVPKTYIEFPIPIPDLKDTKGIVELNWTITSLTDVDALDSDGYTLLCIEDTFHPNKNIYNMYKKGNKVSKKIDINNCEEMNELLQQGYKRSKFQISDSPGYFSEEERRLNLQWDTSKRRTKNKYIKNIKEPCIVLHCIPRNDNILKPIKFCMALNIKVKNYESDLYDKIIEKYPILSPLDIKVDNNISIEV